MKRTIVVVAIAAVGVGGTIWLRDSQRVGEGSFVLLLALSILVALIVAVIERVTSFSLRDLSVQLAKVEKARKEVEQKEDTVRQLSLLFAEVGAFLTAFHRRLGDEETHRIEERWLSWKAEKLLHLVNATEAERTKTFHFTKRGERFRDPPRP